MMLKNYWHCAALVLLTGAIPSHCMIPGSPLYNYLKNHKAPLNIVGVTGLMPNKYSVVYTTISINPEQYSPKQLGPSPLITRAQLGSIGPVQSACSFQALLAVPQIPLDLVHSLHGIPDLAAKIAGAVNPIAGAIGGAVSGILQIGVQMASDQINSMLHTQQTTVGIVEILPQKYYRINRETDEIELTPSFKEDLAAYDSLHDLAVPAIQKFGIINKRYQDKRLLYYATYQTYEIVEDNPASATDYNTLVTLYNNELIPALKTAVRFLKQLEQFTMHRISIIAINANPGDNCINGYHGPFHLYVYMYLGAKAVNTFAIDYCVKDVKKIQPVIIKINPDILSTKPLRWQKGGIKIVAVDKNNQPCKDDCLIGFQEQKGAQTLLLNESHFCSWWDAMIVTGSEGGKKLIDYLLPFDLYKLEADVLAKHNTVQSALTQAATTAVDLIKNLLMKPDNQQLLLDPSTTSGMSLQDGNADLFSILNTAQQLSL